MTVHQLPTDFVSPASIPSVFQYVYKSQQATYQSQVQLTHHLISFLQTGQKAVVLPQKTITVTDGHFLMLSEGQCLMTETLAADDNYYSHLLFFEPKVVEQLLLRHNIAVPVQANANFQVLAYDAFTRDFVHSLNHYSNADQLLLQHKVEEFLLYGYRQYGAAFFGIFKKPSVTAPQRLIQVVEQAIEQQLTVEQMAFLCAMSISTFKRRFAAHYNSSPQAWLREQRLQQAALLLSQADCSLSELAEQLGFQHRSSFSAAFKTRFGLAPRAYKAAQRTS